MKRSDKHNRFRECITAFARPKTNRFFRPSVFLVFFNLLAFSAFSAPQDIKNDQNILREEIKTLSSAKLRSIEPILEQLEKRGAIYLPLFQALLNGQLYFKKSNQDIVKLGQDQKGKRVEEDLFSNAKRPIESISEYKKIRTNNRLRVKLREIISRLELESQDFETRKSAIFQYDWKIPKRRY